MTWPMGVPERECHDSTSRLHEKKVGMGEREYTPVHRETRFQIIKSISDDCEESPTRVLVEES